jgi:hypothetical protein
VFADGFQFDPDNFLPKNKEGSLTKNSFWRGVLIVVLCVAVAALSRGQVSSGIRPPKGTIVGIVAALVVVTVVAIHYSRKRTITGCVNSAGSGMTVTDEKDKQTYALGVSSP